MCGTKVANLDFKYELSGVQIIWGRKGGHV